MVDEMQAKISCFPAVRMAFCFISSGADLLFAELMLRMNVEYVNTI